MAESDVTRLKSAPDVPMAALLGTVQDLWGMAGMGSGGPPSGWAPPTGYRTDGFAVVPNSRTPRLLIPAGNKRAARGSLHRYSADLSHRKAAERWTAAILLGVIGPRRPLAGDRVYAAANAEGGIVGYLGEILGEPVQVSLSIGTERANRKPVLQIFDRRGRSLAFAKLGGSDFTAGLVRREGDALRTVAGRTWKVLRAPEVLHVGQWEHYAVLVMEDLPTRPLARLRNFEQLRNAAQEELRQNFQAEPQPLASTPLMSSIRREAVNLDEGSVRDRLHSVLFRLTSFYGDTTVSVGATHGDWTAWNMASHHGRLHVWDWERFDTGVPDGIDSVHYGLNRYLQTNPVSTESILSGMRHGAPGLDSRGSADHLRAAVYLCALTFRYVSAAGSVRVAGVERKSAAMLKTLEQLLGE